MYFSLVAMFSIVGDGPGGAEVAIVGSGWSLPPRDADDDEAIVSAKSLRGMGMFPLVPFFDDPKSRNDLCYDFLRHRYVKCIEILEKKKIFFVMLFSQSIRCEIVKNHTRLAFCLLLVCVDVVVVYGH